MPNLKTAAHRTTLQKAMARCAEAFRAQVPVLYLQTDELELVDTLIEGLCIRDGGQQLMDFPVLLHPVPNLGLQAITAAQYRNALVNSQASEIENLVQDTIPVFRDDAKAPRQAVVSNWETPHVTVVKNYLGKMEDAAYLRSYILAYVQSPPHSLLRQSVLMLCASTLHIPDGLEEYVEVIEVDFPEDDEIESVLRIFIQTYRLTISRQEEIDRLVTVLRGYPASRIHSLLQKVYARLGFSANDAELIIAEVRKEKEGYLKKSGVLELVAEDRDLDVPGGLDAYFSWLQEKKRTLLAAKGFKDNWGGDSVKGALLYGIPGTGKSLAAKHTAKLLRLPLVSLSINALLGRYVGESEANMEKAIRTAEAMAPCVLWIDELEKAFGGVGSGGDGGVSERLFGRFLTWMQENKTPIFLVATANDISGLPEEFFRNGRFDGAFAMFMPGRAECVEILSNHLKGRAERVARASEARGVMDAPPLFEDGVYRSDFLGGLVDGFAEGRQRFLTGADIKAMLNAALVSLSAVSGARKRPITPAELEKAISGARATERAYGDNQAALHSIAQRYIDMLTLGFQPASTGTLLKPKDYAVSPSPGREDDAQPDVGIRKDPDPAWGLYDRALFDAVKPLVNQLARRNYRRLQREGMV